MMDKVTEAIINKLPRLISQRPMEWARTKPDHPAIVEDKVSWSYRDLAIAVEKTKHLISEHGIRPGDRVLVIKENGRAFVALLFARVNSVPVSSVSTLVSRLLKSITSRSIVNRVARFTR